MSTAKRRIAVGALAVFALTASLTACPKNDVPSKGTTPESADTADTGDAGSSSFNVQPHIPVISQAPLPGG